MLKMISEHLIIFAFNKQDYLCCKIKLKRFRYQEIFECRSLLLFWSRMIFWQTSVQMLDKMVVNGSHENMVGMEKSHIPSK